MTADEQAAEARKVCEMLEKLGVKVGCLWLAPVVDEDEEEDE